MDQPWPCSRGTAQPLLAVVVPSVNPISSSCIAPQLQRKAEWLAAARKTQNACPAVAIGETPTDFNHERLSERCSDHVKIALR